MAALWKLPLLAICENNLYAVETHISDSFAGESITGRAAGFGLPTASIDGQDIVAVYDAVREARERGLAGDGPTFIEMQTYRYEGHNVGDVQNYREKSEVASWRELRDPIDKLVARLSAHGEFTDDDLAKATSRAADVVADAIAFAEQSPWPDTSTVDRAWPAAATDGGAR
jgi:pyruvate dehydrogenase E1 component alpha subunit